MNDIKMILRDKMKFRTEININNYPFQIDYHCKIFGLGSCFVDNIKEKLDYYQFQQMINPFGTVFNPVTIKNILKRIVNQNFFDENDLFFHNDVWKNFDVHSVFNHTDKNIYLTNINNTLSEAYRYIASADFIMFTLGTAWIYKYKKTGKTIGNCHKVSQNNFEKKLLNIQQIVVELNEITGMIHQLNPQAVIMLSISPVRHLKDGFIENQLSKSHLISAVHQLVNQQNILYFPSYEILMDDLRDYRFYKNDMIHPAPMAVDYIWEKFTSALIHPESMQTMKEVEKIQKALNHKSFNPQSAAHINHLAQTQQKILNLQRKYPWMRFINIDKNEL